MARVATEVGLGPGASPGRALALLVAVLVTASGVVALADPSRFGPDEEPAAAAEPPQVDPIGLARAQPVRLVIERIAVDLPVVPLRFDGGQLASPPNAGAAGWYERGTSPGEIGSAVLIGQLADPDAAPGASTPPFGRLDRLVVGDRIDVVRADGQTAFFTVERVAPYAVTERYRSLDARARLRLVGTGTGTLPELVVFATAPDQTANG